MVFFLNDSKTRLQGRKNRQVVTGLTVNKRPNVDRRFVRKTRALIHSIESLGLDAATSVFVSKNPDKKASLKRHIYGRLLFIKQIKGIQSSVYHGLAVRFNNLPIEEKVPVFEKTIVSYPTSKTQRAQFSKRCWVISVESEDVVDVNKIKENGENVKDVEIEEICLQGTAFMVSGGRLVTCAHLFTKFIYSDNPEDFKHLKVSVFKPNDQGHMIDVELVKLSAHHDIAILEFPEAVVKARGELVSDYFQIENNKEISQGELVLVLGNPDLKKGTAGVGAFWSNVTNTHTISAVRTVEIDKEIKDGNSGGPVLNTDYKVVGLAAKGPGGGNVSSLFVDICHLDYFDNKTVL